MHAALAEHEARSTHERPEARARPDSAPTLPKTTLPNTMLPNPNPTIAVSIRRGERGWRCHIHKRAADEQAKRGDAAPSSNSDATPKPNGHADAACTRSAPPEPSAGHARREADFDRASYRAKIVRPASEAGRAAEGS